MSVRWNVQQVCPCTRYETTQSNEFGYSMVYCMVVSVVWGKVMFSVMFICLSTGTLLPHTPRPVQSCSFGKQVIGLRLKYLSKETISYHLFRANQRKGRELYYIVWFAVEYFKSRLDKLSTINSEVNSVVCMESWTIKMLQLTPHYYSNDRPFGYPIIYTDTIHNAILFIATYNNVWCNKVHWLIGTPYLSIIAIDLSRN